MQTKGEYTPGPWQIVPYGDGDSLVICAPNADWRICFMATPGESPHAWQRIKANARLIAAAPELLEALECVTDSLEAEIQARYPVEAAGRSPYPTIKRRYDRDMAEVTAARAAIARAKGLPS